RQRSVTGAHPVPAVAEPACPPRQLVDELLVPGFGRGGGPRPRDRERAAAGRPLGGVRGPPRLAHPARPRVRRHPISPHLVPGAPGRPRSSATARALAHCARVGGEAVIGRTIDSGWGPARHGDGSARHVDGIEDYLPPPARPILSV